MLNMKRIIIVTLLFIFSNLLFGQHVDSLFINPTNPDSNTNISVICMSSFFLIVTANWILQLYLL